MDSGWTMALVESEEAGQTFRDAANEWVFTDRRSVDKFSHPGDTIVPGAGIAWSHVHRTSTGARERRARFRAESRRLAPQL